MGECFIPSTLPHLGCFFPGAPSAGHYLRDLQWQQDPGDEGEVLHHGAFLGCLPRVW